MNRREESIGITNPTFVSVDDTSVNYEHLRPDGGRVCIIFDLDEGFNVIYTTKEHQEIFSGNEALDKLVELLEKQ